MTASLKNSYITENQCFNIAILRTFPLRTRKAKNNFRTQIACVIPYVILTIKFVLVNIILIDSILLS